MKRLYIYIITCILFIGCTESYKDTLELYPTLTPRYLSVTQTSFMFNYKPSTQNMEVKSVLTPWRIDGNPNWLTITPKNGAASATVNIGVTENKSGDDARVGIFYLKSDTSNWDYNEAISVTQNGPAPSITVSKPIIDFNGATNTEVVAISSNCTWIAEKAKEENEWLSISYDKNSILISTTENNTNKDRKTTIYIIHKGNTLLSKTITVTQAPATINASTELIEFNVSASYVDISIASQATWSATSSSHWIDISPNSGSAGNTTMRVSVSPNMSINERTGYVDLSIGDDLRIKIPIKQQGIYIKTDKTELSFGANKEDLNLNVLCNTDWVVSSAPSWINVTPNEGSGDGIIKVTALDNPTTSNRSGEIILTQPGISLIVKVLVSQNGKIFDIGTNVLKFNDKESAQTVEIETNGIWSATTNQNWITLSPTSSSGNSTLNIGVKENVEDNERIGEVLITMGNESATVQVIQQGKYFTVSNDNLKFSSRGGSIGVSIETNDKWTARVEDGSQWITISQTSGYGNIEVKVTAFDNASVKSRMATLLFETTHNQKVRIVVTQDARYLNVDTREVFFYYKGGTSEKITISTDATYKITCSDSWFSINQTNNIFTVTAKEKLEQNPRIGYITITMTDLKEGSYSISLTVTQQNYSGIFLKKNYGDDNNWDTKCDSIIILPLFKQGVLYTNDAIHIRYLENNNSL